MKNSKRISLKGLLVTMLVIGNILFYERRLLQVPGMRCSLLQF